MSKAWEIPATPIGVVRPKQVETIPKKMLDIELFVYGETLLVGRVLYQDESLRGDGINEKRLYNVDGFHVSSYSTPELTSYALYIRGSNRSTDNQPMSLRFSNKETLKKYVCNVKKALAEINKASRVTTEDSGVFKRVL